MSVVSRREFASLLAVSAATLPMGAAFAAAAKGSLQLGLNTYSLRTLSADEAISTILRTMRETGLKECQLWARHVEPARLQSPFPSPADTAIQLEERQTKAAALSAWRCSVPMSYFQNIRARFDAGGVRVRSYSVWLGTTPAEIERQFAMAQALGAQALITRVPESLIATVAGVADRLRFPVGLQFANVAVLQRQLDASSWFRIDPDIGDLTKAGVDALQFVQENYKRFLSIDLKDAVAGAASVPFGQGSAHMAEVLRFLRGSGAALTAYIDCDYEGTGRSVDEVKRCVAYVRQCLAS